MTPGIPLARCFAILLATLPALLVVTARADDPSPRSRAGIGLRAGNAVGPLGAELIVFPARHLSIDVHLAYELERYDLPGGLFDRRGWAVVPSVRAYLRDEGFTPYAAAGVALIRYTAPSGWTNKNLFLNVGPEWRWPSGVRAYLGAGLVFRLDDERDPVGTNFELGVRVMVF